MLFVAIVIVVMMDGNAASREGMSSPPLPHASNNTLHSGLTEKLEGAANYSSWKFSIKMALILDGVWDQIDAADDAIDTTRNQRALARICLSLKSSLYQYVREAKTAKEAWKNLSDVFENKGLYRRILLLRQLHNVKYTMYSDMNEYISAIMHLVQLLADINKTVADDEVSELLLSGLPEEYDSLVSTLETANLTSTLNSEMVRSRLLQEAHRKNESNSNTAYIANAKGKLSKVCHYCSRPGHFKSKCFKWKRDKKKEKETNVSAFLVSFSTSSMNKDFYIDSGASYHMCNSMDLMTNVMNSESRSIAIANNEMLTSKFKGDVHLLINKEVRILKNVLYVPNLSTNLISVSQLVKDGYDVSFNKNGCKILEVSGNCITQAHCVNGIYKFNGVVCVSSRYSQSRMHSLLLQGRQESPSAAVAAIDESLELWHKRLGHLSLSGMCMLQKVANGILLQKPEERSLKDCVACLEGKLTAEPFPKGESKRADKALQIIHSDVAGPCQEASWGGAKYLVTFTDDYTRKTYGYLMRCKSQVLNCFIEFKSLVEKQLDLPIKCLRSDRGGEYCNKGFSDYLKKHGILHQTTVPYTPAQNGVSERLNRTLFEKARCMLQQAHLCKRFWGEAVMTAIYLKNRSPTTALSGCIPEEAWSGSRIDLSHLRVFGCTAYSLIPEQKRRKLDAKAKIYIFVGYSETSKGYRLADPSDPRKVILSRNVAFLEDTFCNQTAKQTNNDICNEIIPDLLNSYNYNNNVNSELYVNDNFNVDNCNDRNFKDIDPNNECVVLSPNNINNSVVSGEEYHSASEDDASRAERTAGEPGDGPVASSSESSDGEGTVVTGPINVTASGRPMRSTRNVLPKRYEDYDLSSMLAQVNPIYGEPLTYQEALHSPEKESWLDAMKSEYNALISNKVWELVD